jgi:hypothetical protein
VSYFALAASAPHPEAESAGVSGVQIINTGTEVNVSLGREIQFFMNVNADFQSILESLGRQIHESPVS